MRLHEDQKLFLQTIRLAAQAFKEQGRPIPAIFIEKDYWICRVLKLMAQQDSDQRTVFKGGTSLCKVHGIGFRFSEDIDIAILGATTLSGNQLKTIIRRTIHHMTEGLPEINGANATKGSHYRRSRYAYPCLIAEMLPSAVKTGELLIEVNAFNDPYPYAPHMMQSFLGQYLKDNDQIDLIERFEMGPFQLNVLAKTKTMLEKLVSLIRCSLADDYMKELQSKIRHFYDLFYLLQDVEIQSFIATLDFQKDFQSLLAHDRNTFVLPTGWQHRSLKDSLLLQDFASIWKSLKKIYRNELSVLAYRTIPSEEEVAQSARKWIELLSAIS